MNHGTNLGSQIGRWIIFAALVVALGALLLTIQPAGAQQDTAPTLSNAVTAHDYDENGKGPITTFRARDPENNPVFWTLGGPDAADFTIVGGTLRFNSEKFPNGPNYEVPTDRANDEDDSGAITPAATDGEPCSGEGACNNVYKVTVRFGAGGEDGAPVVGDDYDGDDLGDIDLTVTVINVNEPGNVVISPRQPQVGTRLTAILTDEDNVAPAAAVWQWASSDSDNGPWVDIADLSDEMTYRPTPDDEGDFLRVTVVYVDRAGADPRTVSEVSEFTVREDIVTSNAPPKFPDQSTLIGGDSPTAAAPTDGRTTTDRFIPESAAAGTHVGPRVTAFDDATEIEVLTYSLRDPDSDTANGDGYDDDGNPDTPNESDGHAASFDIDEKKGQITVSASAVLDADVAAGSPGNVDTPYTVVVRAVDGDGDVENITVRIYVLPTPEPPTIDRVYVAGRVPNTGGVNAGDRAPTEMSHYEADRTPRSATRIDADLDSSVLTDADPPALVASVDDATQPATYFATDPDGGTISWLLAGDDSAFFNIPGAADGSNATLAFATGPDFENPTDMNGDNVYEVTIVASTAGGSDELPVTVKVINSTDDNAPGSVTFSIRQPEVAQRFEAAFTDADGPMSGTVNWQWYRAQTTVSPDPDPCADRMPMTSDEHRVFIVDHTEATVGDELVGQIVIDGTTWTKIPDANGTGSTARYTPEAVFTIDDDGNPTTTHADDSDVSRCLRATFTYRDDVDRTYSGANDTTTDVDETLEGTWAAPEQPVKAIDENNEAPVFTVGGTITGEIESVYRSRVVENMGAEVITEAFAAVDPAAGEDDTTDDLLMYSLGGQDAGAFEITGTLDNNSELDNAVAPDGTLTFNGGANYEGQQEYRVTITATDPGGDSGSVDVIVDVSDVNERPSITMGAGGAYEENRTDPVSTFEAVDPEGSGITYSLQTEPITAADDTDGSGPIAAVVPAAYADAARFEIGPVNGELTFKASPNFEDPDDADTDNTYLVTVRAEVADDTNPRHFATQQVMVIVTNVNEAPMFSDTTQPLQITENPDDAEKEPPLAAGYLYLLNRGAGIPSPANPPAAPNLDVGLPVVAIDDDNNGIDPITGGSTVQLPDAVKYELSGADAGYFDIVPATGQILTVKKLDYEDKNEFNVTVKASDVAGLYDTIDMTINVLDVDEVPVPDVLRIAGESSHTYEENGEDAVGEYKVAAGGDATPGAWTLEGADASSFMLTGSGTTRMLEFRSSPDYDAMADADGDNMYEVTIKVTDSINSDTYDSLAVTVTVDDVDELGVLSGSMTNVSVNEGDADVPGTYTLTAIEDGPAVTWSLDETGTSDFMLEGTGMSRMLKFSSAPDYEDPMGGAADDSNTYMVTVMASAGGEMEMVAVTVTVDNAMEYGTVTLEPTRPSVGTAIMATLEDPDMVMEDTVMWQWASADAMDGDFTNIDDATMYTYTPVEGDAGMYLKAMASYTDGYGDDSAEMVTETAVAQLAVNGEPAVEISEGERNVGTYMASGADNVAWSLTGDDAGDFSINGGQLTFGTAPDFENPADADMDNVYMVTVVATATVGTLMASQPVMVTVTDMDEGGMVTVMPMSAMVGTVLTATLDDPDGGQTAPTWQWSRSGTDIADATSATYTVADSDAGMSLMATATYDDVHGEDKMVSSEAVMVMAADERPQAVQDYDTDGTPGISISELFEAIDDYFDDGLSIAELFEVIDAYFG